MSVDYGSKNRRYFIKSIDKIGKNLTDAYILFSVMDKILAVDNEDQILDENKERVNAELVAIQKHLDEIKITMAEDKHGRIRR